MGNYTNVLPDLNVIPVSTFDVMDTETIQECVITTDEGTFALYPELDSPGLFRQRWQRFVHERTRQPSKFWDDVLDDNGKPAMFVIEQPEIAAGRSLRLRTDGCSVTYIVYDAMLRAPALRDKHH